MAAEQAHAVVETTPFQAMPTAAREELHAVAAIAVASAAESGDDVEAVVRAISEAGAPAALGRTLPRVVAHAATELLGAEGGLEQSPPAAPWPRGVSWGRARVGGRARGPDVGKREADAQRAAAQDTICSALDGAADIRSRAGGSSPGSPVDRLPPVAPDLTSVDSSALTLQAQSLRDTAIAVADGIMVDLVAEAAHLVAAHDDRRKGELDSPPTGARP